MPNSARFTYEFFFTDFNGNSYEPTPDSEDAGYAENFGFWWISGTQFGENQNLKAAFLPATLTRIPEGAFAGCSNLTHVEIPLTAKWFGGSIFENVPLKNVELPDVETWPLMGGIFKSIEQYMKSYCTNPPPGAPICSNLEQNLLAGKTLYVPKGLSGIYNSVWPWNVAERILEATPVELEGEWRTFCAVEDLDFSGVEGLEAYVATEYQDGKVLMEPIEQVPAGTGVVLKGAPGFYEIPYPDQDEALEPVENLLVGLNYGERIQAETEDGQCNLFFNDATEMASLFYGPFMEAERAPRLNAEGEQPMFAPADGARLPYHRAYLQLPASEAGKTVEMVFDTLTGIEDVEAAQPQTDGAIYNLQGQRVVNPGPGIYIQNGRKFVVR